MSYERQNGKNGGVPPQESLGALTATALVRGPAATATSAHPVAAASSSPVGTVLVLGGLGLAGYLVYRHFKKKGGGSAPESTP